MLKIYYWCCSVCLISSGSHEGIRAGQIEEGIEKAVRLRLNEIPEVLKKSYENIKLLFEDEELL